MVEDRDAEVAGPVPAWLGHWWLPLLICIVAFLAEAGGETARFALRYERMAIGEGEYWRLLTGHFVHLGWSHLLMNMLALLLIWLLVGDRLNGRAWLLALPVIIVTIDAGFWWLDTPLAWYVGFSGALHGMLLAGLVVDWRRPGGETWLLGAMLLAKLSYEQLVGPLPGSAASAGGDVVVNAHLYGAVGGLLAVAASKIRVVRSRSI